MISGLVLKKRKDTGSGILNWLRWLSMSGKVGYSEKATKMVTYCDGSQSAKLGKAIKSATNIREHPINGNAEV